MLYLKYNGIGDVIVRVQWIVGSVPGRVKPKTIKLVFAASPLRMLHKRVRAETG
jgi:hypothetical protein